MGLKEDLLRPEAYALSSSRIELRQTHISWVFLLDEEVFKVKKPVSLGFLDFRTLALRKAACEAEVELNRRLSPHVYLGIVPVRTDSQGRAHFNGTGPIIDWAVRMVRLPDDLRADNRLVRGELTEAGVDAIARTLATFHASAPANDRAKQFGRADYIRKNVEENFAQTQGIAEPFMHREEAAEIIAYQTAFLTKSENVLEARMADGRVRDGHGDLRLEHIYFEPDDRVTILDCIEFNERFRFADVCADIAFLSMDLAAKGRVDLAERLLATYARETNDFDLYALVDFYESYRAFVRAKIAILTARDASVDDATRDAALRDARRYFLLSLSAHRRTLIPPSVVAVGGIIASGKSTVADHIGFELGAPVVEADRTRKSMLGVESTVAIRDPAWSGAYDPSFTEKVYAEVLRRADVVLASGRPVVIDASFRSRAMRDAARALAAKHGLPFRLVECRAAPEICRARLEIRERTGSVSDGRLAIFDDFCARFEPVHELPETEHIILDTAHALEASLKTLRESLATWPRGLT